MESRWTLLPFSITTASYQGFELGEESNKNMLPFCPQLPLSWRQRLLFLEAAPTSSALVLMCLRDQGWQGILFIRQLHLLLCRRDTEGSSTSAMQKVHADLQLLWTPQGCPPWREGRSNPHPRQLEAINSLHIPTAALPPTPRGRTGSSDHLCSTDVAAGFD